MKNRLFSLFTLFIASACLFVSCEKQDQGPTEQDLSFLHGNYILNEGAFGTSNASISFFDADSIKMENQIFFKKNQRPIGDVLQSLVVWNDNGYAVVNNSQKIEVINMKTFVSQGVITGLSYPRYLLPISEDKAYVTNGAMAGHVMVVNLNTNLVVDSIGVGFGPEQLVQAGNYLYVGNSGGWATDSTLTVIDIHTDEVLETVNIGQTPIALKLDKYDNLWILCKGKVVYGSDWSIIEETSSELVKFNTSTRKIIERIEIGQTGDYFWPSRLEINGDRTVLYFLEADGIYSMSVNSNQMPSEPIINKVFYGLAVHPQSNIIYGLEATSFTQNGFMFRYHSDGTLIDSFEVGVGPGSVVFN